jgi:hypothetical protein
MTTKRKLRQEASVDFHHSIVNAAYQVIEVNPDPFQSCLTCTHFTENTQFCKRWDARPPPRTVVYGCTNMTI